MKIFICAAIIATLFCISGQAQPFEPNRYTDLSSVALLKQKDSLKKALVCPSFLKEKEM